MLSTKAHRNKLHEVKMSSKECYYCGKVFTRSSNLRRHVPICMMNGQSNEFNPNTGSQETYEHSGSQEQVSNSQEPYKHGGSQEQVSGGQEHYEDRGSREPNEDSDMSSTEGSEHNNLQTHSDQSSEVVSSQDERESEVENECPWSPLQDIAIVRLDDELQELITKYQERGEPISIAEAKAHNKLLPNYRKELRKVLMEKLEWMHELKKDPYYRKIMKIRNDLMDTGDYEQKRSN